VRWKLNRRKDRKEGRKEGRKEEEAKGCSKKTRVAKEGGK